MEKTVDERQPVVSRHGISGDGIDESTAEHLTRSGREL